MAKFLLKTKITFHLLASSHFRVFIMFLDFGVSNFGSFREGVHVIFHSPRDEKIIHLVLCVKGANASGKTQLLKALTFLQRFCSESFKELGVEDDIPVSAFKGHEDEPTYLYARVMLNNVILTYESEITRKGVVYETIRRKIQRDTIILQRNGDAIVSPTPKNIVSGLKNITLRSNSSIISIVNQYQLDIDDSFKHLFQFFKLYFSNINICRYDNNTQERCLNSITQIMNITPKMFNFVKNSIRIFDNSLTNITLRKDLNGCLVPFFEYANGENKFEIDCYSQSQGLKTLFASLGWYYRQLKEGGTLILDDFDTVLHPHILPFLIELFTNKEINATNAQLIFITQNTEIMKSLDKSCIYLVNKENCESYAYPISDLGQQVARITDITKLYNTGKLGGTPPQKSSWNMEELWQQDKTEKLPQN